MRVWDILRITAPLRPESGKCYKIKKIYTSKYSSEQRYVTESWTDFSESVVEPSRTTEFKVGMVVKLNERWMAVWSTRSWLQLPKDSYARVIEICPTDIRIQRVGFDGKLVRNSYKKHHLDICPHMLFWYEANWVAETETLTFFEWPAKKPTVVSAFNVWDKVRVNKPVENKSPNRVDNMDKYNNNILTIKEITKRGYILVKENLRMFHPDRCTPVVTETSGLEPYLLKPKPKFKVGDIVRLIDDSYKNEGKPKWYSFAVAEIVTSRDGKHRYRQQAWLYNWVEEACLEQTDIQQSKGCWLVAMYIDETMVKKHKDLMDNYMNKQIADPQGWQHKYLLSLSKTKPMTDTLKELRFEDYTKKNLKDIVASSEMLDDTLQKLCTLRRRISGFESFVDRTLTSLDRAYENHDKEAIANLLKQASIINKVVNSDLYKTTVIGLEWLEKLDKHFEA